MTGSVSTTVTLAKAAALVVFLAALGGATYGVQVVLGDDATSVPMGVEPVRATLNATGGHTVTYALSVHNRGDEPTRVVARVAGEGAEGVSRDAVVPAGGERTLFVPVNVTEGVAPGDHALDVRVEDTQGEVLKERRGLLTLRVLPEGPGFEPGTSAKVLYVGRIATTDRVFNTNDPAIERRNFEKTDMYRFSSNGLLPIQTVPEPSVVEGFYEGMLGMQPGEWRSFTFPPEKGYGPALVTEEVERVEAVERGFSLELRPESAGRDAFNDYVTNTGQGDAASFEVGDVFHFIQEPNRWPYRIVHIDAQKVEYQIDVQPGEAYSLYPFWVNASEVVEVNETHVRFRTTPTTEVGEAFTMLAHWPGFSAIESVNETHVVVKHSPPVGFEYSTPGSQFEPARDLTVQELTDDKVVVTTPSTNPLAGQTLTFDVYLAELTRGG